MRKRKVIKTGGIILGVLVLVVVLIWPAAPLWVRLGAKPFCIQGDWPDLQIVSCPAQAGASPAVAPRALPTPVGQQPVPLIVDDDGSPDGAVALLYFLHNPLFDVRAVTISCGEAHPAVFAPKIAQVLAELGRATIPVGAGRAAPLEGNNSFPEPWRQSSDAFWGLTLPPGAAPAAPGPAAELIVRTLNNSAEPVAIFVSGGHTNLAEALRLDPGIVQHIREVYIMGGSIHVPGNIKSDWPAIDNSTAEWNIWVDPVAAAEVFDSGVPLHVVPLDATRQVTWTQSDALSWLSSGIPEGALAGEILQWMLENWSPKGVYVWDLAAAAAATDPAVCPAVSLSLKVVVAPGRDQGRTVITQGPPNAVVCLNPDAGQIRGLAAAALAH